MCMDHLVFFHYEMKMLLQNKMCGKDIYVLYFKKLKHKIEYKTILYKSHATLLLVYFDSSHQEWTDSGPKIWRELAHHKA